MADVYDAGAIGSKSMGDTNDDMFWKLLGSFLVFYMQAGFAMLEAGQVRVKNRNVTLIKVCNLRSIPWRCPDCSRVTKGPADGKRERERELFPKIIISRA